MPVDRFSPRTLAGALARARTEHPTITTATYNVDVAALPGEDRGRRALSDGARCRAPSTRPFGSTTNLTTVQSFSASVTAQLSVPIYQGGRNTRRFGRPRKRSDSAGSISTPPAIRCSRTSPRRGDSWRPPRRRSRRQPAQVAAAEIALNGVREEARVGQRTTLDVLNAQQDLVNARVALVTAQRDRVVASYYGAGGDRRSCRRKFSGSGPDLRSDDALSTGPRQLGRRSHA